MEYPNTPRTVTPTNRARRYESRPLPPLSLLNPAAIAAAVAGPPIATLDAVRIYSQLERSHLNFVDLPNIATLH